MITVRTTPGKIPAFDVRELEARLARAARRWDDDLQGRADRRARRGARQRALPPVRRRASRPATARISRARAAVPDIEMMARLAGGEPLGMSLYRPLEAAPGMLRFKLFHLGAPVTLSDSLPMLERMGLKVLDERPHRDRRRRTGRRSGCTTSACSRALADADVEIDALHAVFEDAFGRIFRGEVENDDFNRLVVAARMPAAEIVVLRAYAKYLRQIGFPLSQAFIEGDAGRATPASRAIWSRCSRRASIPDGGAGGGARGGGAACARSRPRSKRVDNLSEDRVLRQYLALILATTRTNFWRRDAEGRAAQLPVVQVRSGEGAGPARAEADVRDLRLLAALRGRAPARRQGRARRPALVGPAGGLPHRGPGPRQGADGEEHRHRAGRLEGRLRAEARARRRPTATRT